MLHKHTQDFKHKQTGLWTKAKGYCKQLCISVVEKGLQLYYALGHPECTMRERIIIIGSLIYFISPIDIIPDLLPGGLIDDFGVLLWALHGVSRLIDDTVQTKAKTKLSQWFCKNK